MRIEQSFSIEEKSMGLGCMSLPENYLAAEKILQKAMEAGIRFFDTADLYQKGLNEENLGRFFQGKRKEVFLASKVGNQWNSEGKSWTWNPRKQYILEAVNGTLRRLKTDYLDLYQLHGGTLEDSWDETLEAFEILKNQGKILAYGISSIRPNVVRKVIAVNPPATIMMQYSPLDRRPEESVFPLLEGTETKVLVRGGFAKGLLINKPEAPFLDYSVDTVSEIKRMIIESGHSPESVLIKFALEPMAVGMLIIGASSEEQIKTNAKAFEESHSVPKEVILALKERFPANRYQDHR